MLVWKNVQDSQMFSNGSPRLGSGAVAVAEHAVVLAGG